MADIDQLALRIAETDLVACQTCIIFDDRGSVLFTASKGSAFDSMELEELSTKFNDREAAIEKGLRFEGKRYEVHRHHPPLVYGRTTEADALMSVGIGLCRVENNYFSKDSTVTALITYELPHTSAQMMTSLRDFCSQYVSSNQHV